MLSAAPATTSPTLFRGQQSGSPQRKWRTHRKRDPTAPTERQDVWPLRAGREVPSQFPGTILHEFDFKGRDGHAAMLEEVWENIDLGAPAGVLPAVWRSAGRYQPLPLPAKLDVPAAGRR